MLTIETAQQYNDESPILVRACKLIVMLPSGCESRDFANS